MRGVWIHQHHRVPRRGDEEPAACLAECVHARAASSTPPVAHGSVGGGGAACSQIAVRCAGFHSARSHRPRRQRVAAPDDSQPHRREGPVLRAANPDGSARRAPSAGRGTQRCPAGALHGAEHRALVREAHLAFRGVHVDVERIRRDVDGDDAVAVAAAGDEPAIRLVDGGEQRAVVHQPVVDDEHEPIARRAVRVRRSDKAADRDRCRRIDVEQIALRPHADDRAHRVAKRSTGGPQHHAAVIGAGERTPRDA